MAVKKTFLTLSLIILITSIFGTVGAQNVYATDGITPLSDKAVTVMLSGENSTQTFESLIETTPDDPNWALVTSDLILRKELCNLPWFDRVFNPCYYPGNTRYWKLQPGANVGKAFPMAQLVDPSWTFDGLYVREGFGFQLYYNTEEPIDPCDLEPASLWMFGPKYVSIDYWRGIPDGFEPNTFFVSGGVGALSNYSIVINWSPIHLTKTDNVNGGDCVVPGRQITYTIDYNYSVTNWPDVNDVNIIDYLPVEVNYVSSDPCGIYNSSAHTVTWHKGTLHSGDFGSFTLITNVNASAEPGSTITNYCEIKSGEQFLRSAYEYISVCLRIIYADKDANGTHNGISWNNAYNYLQDALQDANAFPGYKEIRVAAGTYKPDCNTANPNGSGNRNAAFRLINKVKMKGGYAGYGSPEPNVRDTNLYKTILSGDIGTPDINTDNSYHVVSANSVDETSILDGFTITGGNADGSSPYDTGGGMYNYNGNLIVTNCIFTKNAAYISGGGMYNRNSNPKIINCIFSGNLAGSGGGISNSGNSPKITNCTFTKNSVNISGGGIYNNGSSPTIINSILWGNSAYDNPQIYNYNSSSPIIAYSDIQGELSPAGWDPNADPNLTFNMNFEVYNDSNHTTRDAKGLRVGTLQDYNTAGTSVFGEPGRVGFDANFCANHDASPGPGVSQTAPWASQPNDCKITLANTGGVFDLGAYNVDKHTYSFWFKTMNMTDGTMIRQANTNLDPETGSPDYVLEMRLSGGKLQFYHKNGSLQMETAKTMAELNFAPDVWHHATFIIDRTNASRTFVPTTSQSAKIYVDGLEMPIIVTSFNTLSMNVGAGVTGYLMIGAGEKEFDGCLDNVRLYNRSLTAAQISILSGAHNINVDPCFVNPAEDNYRLLSNSPCIDAGSNNSIPDDYADLDRDRNTAESTPFDIDGFPRSIDGDCNGSAIIDIGAYEFLHSDINHDGVVNFVDFALFAEHWLQTDCGKCGGADLTCDYQVDLVDLRQFVEWWLAGPTF